jgi:hypothetical protein
MRTQIKQPAVGIQRELTDDDCERIFNEAWSEGYKTGFYMYTKSAAVVCPYPKDDTPENKLRRRYWEFGILDGAEGREKYEEQESPAEKAA